MIYSGASDHELNQRSTQGCAVTDPLTSTVTDPPPRSVTKPKFVEIAMVPALSKFFGVAAGTTHVDPKPTFSRSPGNVSGAALPCQFLTVNPDRSAMGSPPHLPVHVIAPKFMYGPQRSVFSTCSDNCRKRKIPARITASVVFASLFAIVAT